MQSRTDPGLLDAVDVAEFLGIPVRSVWVLAEQGQLDHYKVGRRLRFSTADIQAFLERRRIVGSA
jgi:excisionase family DNA binding protein